MLPLPFPATEVYSQSGGELPARPEGGGSVKEGHGMNAIIQLLAAILQALLPELLKKAKDTAEDSPAPGAREDRLREKIRKDGWNA